MAELDLTHTGLCNSLMAQLRQRKETPYVVGEIPIPGGDGRLDVMALRIADNFRTSEFTAYEVKASRSDLLKDLDTRKYEKYLPHVDRFFFAIRSGIAKLDEIPDVAGVIVFVPEKGVWRQVRRCERVGPPNDPAGMLLRCLQRQRFVDASTKPLTRSERIEKYARMEHEAELATLVDHRVKQMIAKTAVGDERIRNAEALAAEKLAAAAGLDEVLGAAAKILGHASRAVAGVHWSGGLEATRQAREALTAVADALAEERDSKRKARPET